MPDVDGTSIGRMAGSIGPSELAVPDVSAQKTVVDDQSQYPSVMEERKVPVKPFLKRKTQAVKFQKVAWKTKSRIDCWNKPEAPKKSKPAKESKQSQMQQPAEQN